MLKRFRVEVEGEDQEAAEEELNLATHVFIDAAKRFADFDESIVFECTDEKYTAMQRNGIPLIYARRVFLVKEKEIA